MLSSRIVLFSVAFWLALGALADRPRMEAAEPNAGRDLSLHHAAGPTARAAQEPGDSDPQTPWYRRLIVGMEVGPTGAQWGIDPTDTGYAARFNGHDVVQQQLAANSQYLVIWGKDSEYAYYDSKVAPKCPGLGSRDVLKEAVESARRASAAGNRLLCRPGQRLSATAASRVPDARFGRQADRPHLFQLRIPGACRPGCGRNAGLRNPRVPHRHARPRLRAAVRLLVREVPRQVSGQVRPPDAQGRHLGRRLGADDGIPLPDQR